MRWQTRLDNRDEFYILFQLTKETGDFHTMIIMYYLKRDPKINGYQSVPLHLHVTSIAKHNLVRYTHVDLQQDLKT